MSTFSRFLHPIPTSCRSYSSFFSSKSGRYFNSVKPPKSVVASSSAVKNTKVKPPPPTPADEGEQGAHSGNGSDNGNKQILKANVDEPSLSQSSSPSAGSNSKPHDNSHAPEHSTTSPDYDSRKCATLPFHTMVNTKEFKLHQFFSLHRPLLLLSNPPSILQTAPPMGPLYSLPQAADTNIYAQSLPSTGYFDALEDNPDAAIDADAEAARQLTRALTMSRAGSTVAWENTLRRLGLDVSLDDENILLQQQMVRERKEAMMDSTKRKRRRKMKKHKLKKRRKATRSTRLKMGR